MLNVNNRNNKSSFNSATIQESTIVTLIDRKTLQHPCGIGLNQKMNLSGFEFVDCGSETEFAEERHLLLLSLFLLLSRARTCNRQANTNQ